MPPLNFHDQFFDVNMALHGEERQFFQFLSWYGTNVQITREGHDRCLYISLTVPLLEVRLSFRVPMNQFMYMWPDQKDDLRYIIENDIVRELAFALKEAANQGKEQSILHNRNRQVMQVVMSSFPDDQWTVPKSRLPSPEPPDSKRQKRRPEGMNSLIRKIRVTPLPPED